MVESGTEEAMASTLADVKPGATSTGHTRNQPLFFFSQVGSSMVRQGFCGIQRISPRALPPIFPGLQDSHRSTSETYAQISEDVAAILTMTRMATPPANVPRPRSRQGQDFRIDMGAGRRSFRRCPLVGRCKPRLSHLLDDLVECLATDTVRFGFAHSRCFTDRVLPIPV